MNELVLIDSSCWIKYFRNNEILIANIVQELIENDKAAICGIIELEIIQGISSEKQQEAVNLTFSILPYIEILRQDYICAAKTIKLLKNKGISVSITDTIISQICIRNNMKLFTIDSDYQYFDNLKLYRI